ncbi:MAG TPA: hypothetical protein VF616_12585 [Duganella sp.]|uniref:WD40 repeat domain-containing protein n=1 Tax=Duganella sp. TaxID=1904440 RepID=UPI002ED16F13
MIPSVITDQLEVAVGYIGHGDTGAAPTLRHRREQMSKHFFAEVVCLSANGQFLAASHFRDAAKRGVVNVFQCVAGRWIPAGKTFEGALPGLYLGNALALSADGRTLAIAGDGDKKTSGAVTIYVFHNGCWHRKGRILRGRAATHFGSSVALSADGDVVAIGQRSSAGGGTVHVFRYLAGNWVRMGQCLDDAVAEGDFGIAVSLSGAGDLLAIGANSFNAGRRGSVSIFGYADQIWHRRGEPLKGGFGEHFGTAVKLCARGETVVIGSPSFNDRRGAVYAYRFLCNAWVQLGTTLTGDHPDAYLGNAVDLSEDGTMLIVGSDGLRNASGAVLVYLFDGSNWIRASDALTGAEGNSYFGLSVSLSAAGRRIASANLNVLNASVVHHFTVEYVPAQPPQVGAVARPATPSFASP